MTTMEGEKTAVSCCNASDRATFRPLHLVLGLALIGLGAYAILADTAMLASGQLRPLDIGALLFLGLLTGLHCIGMCGGMVLIYRGTARARGLSPLRMHGAYAAGKTIAYTFLGAVFGFLGGLVSFSPGMRGMVGVVFGAGIAIVGLGMVWRFPLNRILMGISKKFSRHLPRVRHPFTLGVLNGGQFLCGPLQAMYLLAAGSADPFQGAVLMLAFGLGTLPAMMAFAFFTDLALPGRVPPGWGRLLARATAIIVVTFGLVTLNRGLALVGPGYDLVAVWARLHTSGDQFLPAADETQIIAMTATESGWSQAHLTLRRGVPARWIIEGEEITNCNKTLTVPALGLSKDLLPGTNIIEFTPRKTGIFTYTCWMGMMKGILEIREPDGVAPLQRASAHSGPNRSGN